MERLWEKLYFHRYWEQKSLTCHPALASTIPFNRYRKLGDSLRSNLGKLRQREVKWTASRCVARKWWNWDSTQIYSGSSAHSLMTSHTFLRTSLPCTREYLDRGAFCCSVPLSRVPWNPFRHNYSTAILVDVSVAGIKHLFHVLNPSWDRATVGWPFWFMVAGW